MLRWPLLNADETLACNESPKINVCSEEPPAGNRNKEAGSNRVQAEEEMNRYVENLKKAGRWPIDLSKVQGLNYENFEKVQISSEYVDFFTFLF